ncbi:DUF6415 family natural product biosynthesis protein [Streptomyces lydicus]|uniref:DUF6415 family natural product biosynthesis protein n=1 Tax=Streptomyces lydicus TaxID=47763 RepID=UPI00344A4A7B
MRLVQAVIAWGGRAAFPPRDYDQIALQLTGHAWAVVAEVRRCCTALPPHAEPRVLAEVVLEEADRRLAQPRLGPVRCAQMHARQVGARYERLSRLQSRPAGYHSPLTACSSPRGSGERSPGTPHRGAPRLLHSAAQYSSHAVMLRGSQTRVAWAHGPGRRAPRREHRTSFIDSRRPAVIARALRSGQREPGRFGCVGLVLVVRAHIPMVLRVGGPDHDGSAVRTAADLLRSPGRAPPAASWSSPQCVLTAAAGG